MFPAVSFFLCEKSDVTNYLIQRQDFDKTFTAGENFAPIAEVRFRGKRPWHFSLDGKVWRFDGSGNIVEES